MCVAMLHTNTHKVDLGEGFQLRIRDNFVRQRTTINRVR